MTFPTNNLPTQSKYWGREVEKKITNLESSFKSAEINNVTRDSQLTVTAGQALAAANQANAAAAQAQIAADDAAEAASLAGTAAGNAQNAINGLIGLGEPGSAYDVAAGNISAGTVTGLSITGGSLNTAAVDGKSVSVAGTRVDFKSGSSSVANLEVTGDGKMGVFGSGLYLSGGATGTGVFGSGGLGVGDGSITTNYNVTAASGEVRGNTLVANVSVTASSANITGSVSGGSYYTTGDSTLNGRIISAGTYGSVASSTANVLINSNNYFQRTTSSRRYKSDIQDIDYGMVGLEIQPRTWVDKSAYEENGNSAEGLTRIVGFIAEELDDLGLTELVQYNDDGTPEAVNYDRMTVLMVPVIKQQQQLIEQLTARIEALESR